jgi:small nuclear ribonucleoprotein (snRNP)-like protein
MIENVVPVNLVHGNMIQANQQQYPIQKPEEQDVLKFKLELEPGAKTPPIFEATNKTVEVRKVDNTVFGLLKGVDNSYHHVLTNMRDLARDEKKLDFKSLSLERGDFEAVRTQPSNDIQGAEFVRTPDDIKNKDRARYKELLANQEENQLKAMQMMHDMTNKTIGAQMFMSNIKVIGAAISQLSQGFKTLFRSSG